MSEREKFEKWAKRMGYADEFDVPFMKHAALEGWQAALSTRKPYGWIVVNKAGSFVSGSYLIKNEADREVLARNENGHGYGPFRVVELFYEDSES